MKATIEIQDDLYRKLEEESARQGRPIDAVTIELLQRSLADDASAPGPASKPASDSSSTSADSGQRTKSEWLEDWLRFGEELSRNAPPGPSAREMLEADRNHRERYADR